MKYKHVLEFNKFVKKYSKINEGLFENDNKIKKYEKILIDSVINFMKSELIFDAKIKVKKKNSKILIGDISLSEESIENNKFILHYNNNQTFKLQIESLIHELTHIKQVVKGELSISSDLKNLIWKGEKYPVKDYKKLMKNYNEYIKIPWESEAYSNMKVLCEKYFKSNFYSEIYGKDPTLNFIIDNM